MEAAIKLYYDAIRADPDYAPALNHFAWLRATDRDPKLRNGAEAVRMSERACKAVVEPDRPNIFAANCLDTLAAAYAEAGRFDDAVKTAGRAIAMAEELGKPNAARSFADRMRQFEKRQPHRE